MRKSGRTTIILATMTITMLMCILVTGISLYLMNTVAFDYLRLILPVGVCP